MDWLMIAISSGARGNQDKVRQDKLVRSNRWKSGTCRHRFSDVTTRAVMAPKTIPAVLARQGANKESFESLMGDC
jgi:hypothetical protein